MRESSSRRPWPDERMSKCEVPDTFLVDESCGSGCIERIDHGSDRCAADTAYEPRFFEDQAADRGDFQQRSHVVGKQREPSADHDTDALRHTSVDELIMTRPLSRPITKERHVTEVSQQRTNEVRVASGEAADIDGEIDGWLRSSALCDQRAHVAGIQADQPLHFDRSFGAGITEQHRRLRDVACRAKGADDHQPAGDAADEVAEQQLRRRLGPLQVVDHQ